MAEVDGRSVADSDVAVVTVVRGPPAFVRVRGGPIPRAESAAYASATDALVELSDWLVSRLDDSSDDV